MRKRSNHQIATAIMKISIAPVLILTLAFSSYAKDTNGQEGLKKKISLEISNEEIGAVFSRLETLSDLRFVYSPEIISASRKISLNVRNKELYKVLKELLKPLNIQYELDNNYIILATKETASNPTQAADETRVITNDKTISGKITSATGEPLEGVSVVVKGTNIGTTTNRAGQFRLSVPEAAQTLVITYVGYQQQEVSLNGKTSLNISMAAGSNQLTDVVVIGYGTQKKVTVTGAVATVKGDDIKDIPVGSVANTLVGRMPGLIAKNTSGEPGFDDSRLLIRGVNSYVGDNAPLVVVDGVADRAGGFSRIDVNDIESVTILKDASAAIYGSRAGNGVILVTTKRGRAGKTSVGYTVNYGLRTPTILPKMVDATDYAIAINDITRLIDKNPVPTYTQAEIQKFRDGSDPINYPNVNPIKEALKDYSQQIRHNLTVSGGSENVRFFTSLGYQYENNIYKASASNYKQYNLRSNLDIQATRELKVFANLAVRQEDRNSPYQSGFGSGEVWRNIVQGDPRQLIQYPNGLRRAVTSGGYNPLTAVDGTTGYGRNRATFLNADLGFAVDGSRLLQGLGLDGRLSVDRGNILAKSFNKRWTLYTLNNATNQYDPNQYGPTNASLTESMSVNTGITANIRLLYNATFNNVHHLNTFVAYEQYDFKYDYLQASRQNFTSTAIDQIFAGDAKSATNNGSADQSARQNYFGRVDYSYAEKYLAQFNWRYDGSERFAKENRFGFFPGISLGWRASEEDFWKKNLSFINSFKLRGSWGKMGYDRIFYNGQEQRFTFLTQFTFGQNAIFGGGNPQPYQGIVLSQTANPNAQWEVATTYNVGMEGKLLRNALAFEFDVFKQKRSKILDQATASVPQYAGISLPAENIGAAQSHGFEGSLNYTKNVRSFKYNVGVNFTYAKSKIVNFNEPESLPDWQKRTGKPIGANWLMYEAIGIYRNASDLGKHPQLGNADLGDLIYRDVNGDGKLDGNDQVRLSQTEVPEIIYGITMGAAYKNFELSLLWQGAGNVSQYVFYEGGGGGIGTYTQDYFDNRWTPENPDAKGPRIYDREKTATTRQNTYFLHNASYLRLKNAELSYNLPQSLISRLHLANCSVFIGGFNLLTFTRLKDIDPEATASRQNYAGWFNVQNKVYNFGLNITF